MQVGTTKDQGFYNKPSTAVHPGASAAETLPQYNNSARVSGFQNGGKLTINLLLASRKEAFWRAPELNETPDVETDVRGSRCNAGWIVRCERQWNPNGLSSLVYWNVTRLQRIPCAPHTFWGRHTFLKLDLGSEKSIRFSDLFSLQNGKLHPVSPWEHATKADGAYNTKLQ